jgi:hypothetical protein
MLLGEHIIVSFFISFGIPSFSVGSLVSLVEGEEEETLLVRRVLCLYSI